MTVVKKKVPYLGANYNANSNLKITIYVITISVEITNK